MAQVSFGTITITDTNDIESITIEYARNQSTSTAPTSGWSTTRPDWAQGYYIWQRARIHKSGTESSSDTFGTAVCLTGSTGSTGATGRGISSIATSYCNYGTGTPAASYSGWQSTVPAYDSTKPNYWVKTVITYTTGSPATDTSIYKDNGITDAVTTSAEANATATDAWNKADDAQDDAAEALALAQNTNYAWWSLASAKTVGQNTFAAGSYGTFIRASDFQSNPTNQPNIFVDANGLHLRRALTDLASFTGTALTFNNPTSGSAQLVIGASGTLQSGNYSRGNDTKFAAAGTKIDLITGEIYTPYFRLSQGLDNVNAGAYVHGTIEALDGRIGTGYTPVGGSETNYWDIGDYTDYNLNNTAKIIGHGSSFIQLGDAATWRLSTNRIHTGWYNNNDTVLHYPQDSNNKYWDFGIHVPYSDSPSGRGNDKFIYIRTQKAQNTSLTNLLYDIDDNYSTAQWDYKFWIDREGKVHAQNFYVGNSTTPIGGGAGTIAEKLLTGAGSTTQPVYFRTDEGHVGEIATTTYQLNAAGAKGIDTSMPTTATDDNVPTTLLMKNFVEGKGYITSYTDEKVKIENKNTTKLWVTGTATAGTTTGTLAHDTNIYIDTTAGALHATTFNGYTLAAASAKGVDTSLTTSTTSTNLPTSAAVVNLIKQYLPLTGGNVTGAVTFGSSVSVDELTVGDLVVNGAASFTNNLQANTINGIVVGNNPKFTDTVTTVTVTGSGNAITSMTASNGAITATKGSTFLTSETDPIFVASAAHDITSNDISNWNSKTSNTGTVTSVRVQASSPLQSSVSTTQNESLNTTISFTNQNANTVLAGPASGSTAAAPTFRKLVAADIPDISGTYYLASNPNGYTTNTGTVTSVKVQGSNGLTGSGTVTTNGTITISHATGTGSSSSNSGRTYIQSITLDTYGHITGISTATETVTDTHHTAYLYNGSAASGSNATANKAVTTGNVYLNLVENGSIRNSHKLIAANGLTITSNTSGDITFTSPDAFISVEAVNTGTEQNPTYVLRFTKSGGGTTDVSTANIAVIQSEGANKLVTAGTTTGIDVTGPVKFVAGVPVTMSAANGDSIPSSLISGTISPSSHTHGNITNGGEITSTVVTVSNNDALLFADSSNNGKIERLAVFDGSTTTQFLSKKGTWETPVGSVTGVKGNSESSYRTGNVNLTASNIGAATSGHTHTTTLAAAASGDTSQLTLAYNTKYKLTAGGTDYIFTMPASDNTDTHRPIQLKGTEILGNNTTALNFAEGNNITLSNSGGTITINSSYTNTDEKIKLSVVSTETGTYPLMLAPTGTLTSGNTYQGYYNTGITVTPNTKTITATTFAGNASSATEFSSGTTVKLTGNVTGESSSSKKGWTISTTIGNGVVTNAMLAGSIANGKLTNSSITIGSKTINLGDTVTLAEIGAGTSNLTLGTTSTTAYRGDYGNTAYTHATDSGRLTTAKSSAFYKFSVTAHGHVGSVTAVTGSDISGLLSFGTAYNSSSNKIATISDVTSAIDGATNKYVTIATDQTITASQKTFNGATRWSVTNSATGSKYGACNYDATLDALVFSFGTI